MKYRIEDAEQDIENHAQGETSFDYYSMNILVTERLFV